MLLSFLSTASQTSRLVNVFHMSNRVIATSDINVFNKLKKMIVFKDIFNVLVVVHKLRFNLLNSHLTPDQPVEQWLEKTEIRVNHDS